MKKLGWIIFAFLVIYFIFMIRQDIIDNFELRKEVQAVTKNYQLEEKNAGEIEQRLAGLKQGALVEELARTKLGLVRKDESAYKVIR